MTIENVQKRLMTLFCTAVAVAVITATVYETELLYPGWFACDAFAQIQFILTAVMELLTIVSIPLSLRLFKMLGKKVHTPQTLLRYGVLRILMLAVPLWGNTILYYLFVNATFGYMAIICLIATVFVLPTKEKCMSEESHL